MTDATKTEDPKGTEEAAEERNLEEGGGSGGGGGTTDPNEKTNTGERVRKIPG